MLLIILQVLAIAVSLKVLVFIIPVIYFTIGDLKLSLALIFLVYISLFKFHNPVPDELNSYSGIVTTYPIFKSNGKVNFSVDVSQHNFTAYVTAKQIHQGNSSFLKKGDYVYFQASCNKLKYSLTGYESSLARRYDAKCNAKFISKPQTKNQNLINNFRDLIIEVIYGNTLNNLQADLILSMTFGIESLLSEKVVELFKVTGLAHLLVVSGMHVSTLFVSLVWLFKYCTRYSLSFIRAFGHLYIPEILSYLIVCFYIDLIGFEPAAIRALIALSLVVVGKIICVQLNLINNIIASLLIINIFYPLIIFEPGTQLTYVTLTGIYAASFLKPNVLNYLIGSSIISCASSLVTLFWFGTFSWLSFILNPIFAPIIGIITCQIALIIIVLNLLGLNMGIEYLGIILEYFVKLIEFIVNYPN